MTAKHQLHQASHLIPPLLLGRTIYSLSQVPDPFLSELPINSCPSQLRFLRSDVIADAIFHVGSVPLHWVYRGRLAGSLPAFAVGQSLNPYPEHYPKHSLSPASFTR
ncbi:hypothetical protein [Gloeocapsopsis sp. IPPAS B-1203]|uniref:hypothetical protein n=1 Tax=Gloeocapsopsis sp. IPPAS B-1203 TaxID=2049454 RepID=UPI0025A02F17|nr:hypothetical protein [Gloeocapsopsis sp. IPPAS B-1203]